MKKIVFYIGTMGIGGAERVMNNLITYFCNKNVGVILINDIQLDSSLPKYDVDSRAKRCFLQNDIKGNVLTKNILRIMKLRKIINRERPDLIISFLGPQNLRMLFATVGLSEKKIVSVRNDPNKEYGDGFWRKKIINTIFRLADGVVFQTTEAQRYFTKSVQKKSTIIYNPVSKVFFNTEYVGDEKAIVALGRLEPQKNSALLIRAFSQISDKYPEYKLVFYGKGSLQNDLECLSEKLNIRSRVFFAGATSNVSEVLKHCSIFVLSSDYEGMPNALMEAMAVGVPCISTDCPCGGPRELIAHNKDGLLVEVGNVEKMAEALGQLLSNPQKRLTLGKEAKIKALIFESSRVFAQWDSYLGA